MSADVYRAVDEQRARESAMRAFEQYLADVPKAPNTAEVRALVEKIKAALSQK